MPRNSTLAVGLVPLLVLLYLQLWNPSGLDKLYSLVGLGSTLPARSKTPIIMAATPAFSHMEKITTITEGLVALGYPVIFIAGVEFESYIKSIGAEFVPIEGSVHGMLSNEDLATFATLRGDELEIFATKSIFIDPIPAQYRTLQRTFKNVQATYGEDTKLVYLFDCSFSGLTPVMHGGPGIRPYASIGIGIAPYPGSSNDTFPFRSGKTPDTSENSQSIHYEAQKEQYNVPVDKSVNANINAMLAEMGATRGAPSFYDMFTSGSDIYLQYGIPEFDYNRSDIRPNYIYAGAPVAVGMAEHTFPEWWDDVLEARKAGKHIVAVTSSSVVFDTNALIIPALEALKARNDVFVIATLVTSEVEQNKLEIPENARVAKFISLDMVMPYISVLISNGGYGTVLQALSAGIPMILSGNGQDKAHTGALVAWAGVGIYHAVPQVTAAMVTDSFEEILSNGTYRANSKTMAKRFGQYNALSRVDETIQKVLRGDYE